MAALRQLEARAAVPSAGERHLAAWGERLRARGSDRPLLDAFWRRRIHLSEAPSHLCLEVGRAGWRRSHRLRVCAAEAPSERTTMLIDDADDVARQTDADVALQSGDDGLARKDEDDGAAGQGGQSRLRAVADDDAAGAVGEPAVRASGSAVADSVAALRDAGADPVVALRDAGADPAALRDGTADPVAALRDVVATLDALAGTAWHDVSGQSAHDALDQLEQAGRRLAAVRAEVLSVVDGNGLWTLHGSRTFSAWLRARTGSTAGAASRQVRESRALRDHLPLAREALAAGTIGADHASALVRETTRTAELRAQLAHPEVGEAFLVDQAAAMDAGTFTQLVRSWALAADPEGADRAWRQADAKEELTIAPTTGGFHVNGWLDQVSGQLVNTALRAHAGRKGAEDKRTPAQRRAAALVSLAHQSLDAGLQGTSARVRPHITVTTSLEMIRALAAATGSPVPPLASNGEPYPPGAAFGPAATTALDAPGGPRDPNAPGDLRDPNAPGDLRDPNAPGVPRETDAADPPGLFELSPEARAWADDWRPGQDHVISTAIDHELLRGIEPATLEDGSPLPPALLARLVCESQLSRVIFGADSTIVNVGREKRLFTASQARAIIARDRHCQYPDCDEPPGFGEIHHSISWARHRGATDAELGILLCWHHHDWVHLHEMSITRSGGRWWFRDRHGALMTATMTATGRGDDPPVTS